MMNHEYAVIVQDVRIRICAGGVIHAGRGMANGNAPISSRFGADSYNELKKSANASSHPFVSRNDYGRKVAYPDHEPGFIVAFSRGCRTKT